MTTPTSSTEKALSRIAGALSLAERASSDEERDAAMAMAQKIASTYSLDLAKARSHLRKGQRRSTPTHRTITLGAARKKGLRTYANLFIVICDANDIEVNIAHNSTWIMAFGFEEDIALAEALYASLVVQMVAASDAYLKTGTYRDDTVYKKVTKYTVERDPWGFERQYRHTYWDHVQVSGSMARINFQQAYAERVGARLVEAREQARQDAIEADRAEQAENEALMRRTGIEVPDTDQQADRPQTSTELAIVEKAVEVRDYYKTHSKAKGTWRGASARTDISRDARQAGRTAGDRARLGTEKEIGGSRKAIAS